MMKRILIASLALAMCASVAMAHGEKKHGKKQKMVPANLDMVENEFGRTGDPKKVTRTIKVAMVDEMKFEPAEITVKVGDTIRILAENHGETLHELVIGRHSDLVEHAKLMQKFPNMEHSEPYMAHADEGQTAEIIWTFTKPGTFEYGCLVPGHFEAGMKGVIVVSN